MRAAGAGLLGGQGAFQLCELLPEQVHSCRRAGTRGWEPLLSSEPKVTERNGP